MATPTVFLHVGLPKTGTTFLQDMLRQHRETLAEQGLRYPRGRSLDHFHAALDARGDHRFGMGEREQAQGAWPELVGRALDAPDRAVISHELFATCDAEHARRALADLDSAEVHVVVTARDPARQVVADWAESVKHGRRQTFEQYLRRAGITGGQGSRVARRSKVFRAQRLPEILEHWSYGIPPERVHVVTVPPAGSDPGLLWRRFAGLLGVGDPDGLAPGDQVRANARLGVADVELVRRVAAALDRRIVSAEFGAVAKTLYAQTILPTVSVSQAPTLPERHHERVDLLAAQWRQQIAERGYDVVGDLDDLAPRHRAGPAPDDWDADQLLETAVAATAELLVAVAEQRRELSPSRTRPTALSARARAWPRAARHRLGRVLGRR